MTSFAASIQRFGRNCRGFTLIELLIVMTILGILASISIPSYKQSVIKARETVLMENLYQMRHAIDAFYADKAKYPDSLDQLIEERYLRDVPRDPFTDSKETWETVTPEADSKGAVPMGSVYDVHSGSDLVGLNNIPYKEW